MTTLQPIPAEVVAPASSLRLLACASQGSGGDDEARLRTLLQNFDTHFLEFDRANKRGSFLLCLKSLRHTDCDLFVLEGTGVAAGMAAVIAHYLFRRRFVLSSGDAVGPFLSALHPWAAAIFHLYERLLYRASSGFIGWTPYLVGRALTLGAQRAMTCPGWAPFAVDADSLAQCRVAVRQRLRIPADAIVYGIAGALVWSERYQYCYGMELVRAAQRSKANVYVLIVGDGTGMAQLRATAGTLLGRTVLLPGRVRRDHIPGMLAAMDVGSLPQSIDNVGSFRYTTKISEYRSVGLPFLTNQVPLGYDLDRGDLWRMQGSSPWDETFVESIAAHMDTICRDGLPPRDIHQDTCRDEFDRDRQIRRTTAFLTDIARAAPGLSNPEGAE